MELIAGELANYSLSLELLVLVSGDLQISFSPLNNESHRLFAFFPKLHRISQSTCGLISADLLLGLLEPLDLESVLPAVLGLESQTGNN